MAESTDYPFISSEHLEAIQDDLLRRGGSPKNPASELDSLREFNSQLLVRIGEFRKQNLQLSASENALRSKCALQEKQLSQALKENQESTTELGSLRKALVEQNDMLVKIKNELNRKLAELADDNWDKSLKIENLQALEASHKDQLIQLEISSRRHLEETLLSHQAELNSLEEVKHRLSAEIRQISDENTELRAQLGSAKRTESEQAQQLDEAGQLLTDLEAALEANKDELEKIKQFHHDELLATEEKNASQCEAFSRREKQLVGAFESLRAEYSRIDHCYQEATETVARLRTELGASEIKNEAALVQQRSQLHADFHAEREAVAAECKRLQQLLLVRDTRAENERTQLQTWREQLGYLEQHLQQVSDSLKKDKAEVLRISKQTLRDLQVARAHPFKEYLEIAELECSHLQAQLGAISAMSPLKSKLESRLAQAQEHRDGLKSLLTMCESQMQERLKTVNSVISNL